MSHVTAKPLTAEAFAPFGDVFDISTLKGAALAQGAFSGTEEAKLPVMQMVKVGAIADELTVRQLELHPFSSQSFLALDMASSLIVVCEPDAAGQPDVSTLQAFTAAPHQVVTYKRGVLHHRLTPLKAPASFAMTMYQTGAGGDTILYDLQEPVNIADVAV